MLRSHLLLDEPLIFLLTLSDEVCITAVGGCMTYFAWQQRHARGGVLRRNPSGPAGWHQFPCTGSVVIELCCFIAPLEPYICWTATQEQNFVRIFNLCQFEFTTYSNMMRFVVEYYFVVQNLNFDDKYKLKPLL